MALDHHQLFMTISNHSDDLTSRLSRLRDRDASVSESLDSMLGRIHAQNSKLNAYHEILEEPARDRALQIDETIASGDESGVLAGALIAIKDNICTRSGRTTCSSKMLENYQSPFDATVIEKLEAAGAIVIGKTNMDEFAMGSSSEHCAWGVVRNPHDHLRVPGGSSGGSAVSVAANLADAALGSDTGGSIRQPAAFCGCVGFKPTYGRVSRWGLVAFGSSLDQIGPMTRSVRDAALLYSVIAGPDARDSTSLDRPVENPVPQCDASCEGLRIGVARQFLSENNDPAIRDRLQETIDRFQDAGAEIVDIDLPLTDHGISTYYIIAPAEASSNLSRFDGIRYGHRAKNKAGDTLEDLYARTRDEGFGPEVKRRIMLGTYVLSSGYYDAYYTQALKVRRCIRNEYEEAFSKCDVLMGPTTPTPAFSIGQKPDPLSMYLNDVYTVNANIAGIPAISVPAGTVDADGTSMPCGIHLQANAYQESTVFKAAAAVERMFAD